YLLFYLISAYLLILSIRFSLLLTVLSDLSFFFSSSGDPRDLHSFPTRRSSDLSRFRPKRSSILPTPTGLPPSAGMMSAKQGFQRDRKSTRLNSSHVSISYAVFCLKKKIKEEWR